MTKYESELRFDCTCSCIRHGDPPYRWTDAAEKIDTKGKNTTLTMETQDPAWAMRQGFLAVHIYKQENHAYCKPQDTWGEDTRRKSAPHILCKPYSNLTFITVDIVGWTMLKQVCFDRVNCYYLCINRAGWNKPYRWKRSHFTSYRGPFASYRTVVADLVFLFMLYVLIVSPTSFISTYLNDLPNGS